MTRKQEINIIRTALDTKLSNLVGDLRKGQADPIKYSVFMDGIAREIERVEREQEIYTKEESNITFGITE